MVRPLPSSASVGSIGDAVRQWHSVTVAWQMQWTSGVGTAPRRQGQDNEVQEAYFDSDVALWLRTASSVGAMASAWCQWCVVQFFAGSTCHAEKSEERADGAPTICLLAWFWWWLQFPTSDLSVLSEPV